ncbi:MAG: indole-3-glycerol phosphate synthase TrpC [Caldithrix sp.]|nr:indole-3-glycerol phosphate synthase TrpC [Caldithrix sp.]
MSILETIIESKKKEVHRLKSNVTLSDLEKKPLFRKPVYGFKEALVQEDHLAIIAEIKQASPSKGVLRAPFDPVAIARTYQQHQVNALSILTDEPFFKGSLQYLADIAAFKTAPLLRKDFIIDDYQIYEARSYGADAILLIAEVLSREQIHDLTSTAHALNMDVLLEIHSAEQIDKIDFRINDLIGINNRNLDDFTVNLNTTQILCNSIPSGVTVVSESGIHNKDDLEFIKNTHANAVLIGEHLMRSVNMDQELKHLKKWSRRAG